MKTCCVTDCTRPAIDGRWCGSCKSRKKRGQPYPVPVVNVERDALTDQTRVRVEAEERRRGRSERIRRRESLARLAMEAALLSICPPIDADTRIRVEHARHRLSWAARWW